MFKFLQKVLVSRKSAHADTPTLSTLSARAGLPAHSVLADTGQSAAKAFKQRGNQLLAQGDLDGAARCYSDAHKADPLDAFALVNLGYAYCELKRDSQAREVLEQALTLDPALYDAHFMLGNLAQNNGNMVLATWHFREVFRLQPEFDFTSYFADEVQYEAATTRYEAILSIDPCNAAVHVSLGMTRLILGDYRRGWPEYQWRFSVKSEASRLSQVFRQPIWLGKESLQNKTILLHCEQGLGDTLQFCRYAGELASRGALVVLLAPPALMGVLKGLAGVHHLVRDDDPVPAFDFHCPVMSLPLALEHHQGSVVCGQVPYLSAEPERIARWRERLDAWGLPAAPRVGIAWSGNPAHQRDRQRSLSLAEFIRALPPDLDLVCLQPAVREADRAILAANPRIAFPGESLSDFTDTAALIACLDLVLTVDTSVAHLAGAMGKPAWVLVSYGPDWRWLLERSDTPWYPSLRLFRQQALDDWSGALDEVRGELQRLTAVAGRQA